jgi:poly(A) polymerase
MTDLIARVAQMLGAKVYLVGGSVRDHLMGRESSDLDFVTPLSPEEISARLRAAGRRPFVMGHRFGAVGARLGAKQIEIATFRAETYRESEAPEVQFLRRLTDDLAHRDFTMNAMAMGPGGALHDPFGGAGAIEQGVIACVGNPAHRFREDPLRMIRAARFAAQLGFTVEAETLKIAAERAPSILQTARERWVLELDKLLAAADPTPGLRCLAQTRVLNFILPELALQVGYDQDSPYHELDLWEHTLRTVRACEPDVDLRWAALLHDVGKPFVRRRRPAAQHSSYLAHELVGAELVIKIGAYLRWSGERTRYVASIVSRHMDDDSALRAADESAKR